MPYVKFIISECGSPMTFNPATGYVIDQRGVMLYVGTDFEVVGEQPEEQHPFGSDTVLKLAAILSDTQNGKAYLEGDK